MYLPSRDLERPFLTSKSTAAMPFCSFPQQFVREASCELLQSSNNCVDWIGENAKRGNSPFPCMRSWSHSPEYEYDPSTNVPFPCLKRLPLDFTSGLPSAMGGAAGAPSGVNDWSTIQSPSEDWKEARIQFERGVCFGPKPSEDRIKPGFCRLVADVCGKLERGICFKGAQGFCGSNRGDPF
jgi:hypothetical protein